MIGGTYEYLISSLPELYFQNTDEVKRKVVGLLDKYSLDSSQGSNKIEILDNEAQKFLPVALFRTFQNIRLNNIHQEIFQHSNSKVLSSFSKFRYDLLKTLKTKRTSQNKNTTKRSANKLETLIKTGTPLEIEIQLMKYQWQKLEEISVGHLSDFEAVFTYKIKLLILQRWWSFDPEKGFEIFSKLTAKASANHHYN